MGNYTELEDLQISLCSKLDLKPPPHQEDFRSLQVSEDGRVCGAEKNNKGRSLKMKKG